MKPRKTWVITAGRDTFAAVSFDRGKGAINFGFNPSNWITFANEHSAEAFQCIMGDLIFPGCYGIRMQKDDLSAMMEGGAES